MNLHLQFQMEDVLNKKEKANKRKSTAGIFIIIGSILALIGICLFVVYQLFPSTSTANQEFAGQLGCLVVIGIFLGLPSLAFIIGGIYKRVNANHELQAAEEQNKILRQQMMVEEDRKSSEK